MKSAESGYAHAQYLIGLERLSLYIQGAMIDAPSPDVDAVKAEGRKWLTKAAVAGHAKAQLSLGKFYEHEWRGDLSGNKMALWAEAVGWYRKAAAGGSAEAREHLEKLGETQ